MTRDDTLRLELDDVARRASMQLERASARDAVRGGVGRALALSLAVPLLAVLVQVTRLLLADGRGGAGWAWWWLAPLTIVPAAVFLVWRFRRGGRPPARDAALIAVDTRIRSADRLRTADDFLAHPGRSGFMQAAVEDAARFVAAGRDADVTPPASPIHARLLERAAVPATLALLLLAVWLSRLAAAPGPASDSRLAMASVAATAEERAGADDPSPPETIAAPPRPDAPPNRAAGAHPLSCARAGLAEHPRGRRRGGRLARCRSDERERPVVEPVERARCAVEPGAALEAGHRPEEGRAKAVATSARNRAQTEQPPQDSKDPAGATAGQGSSKGSNRNPAVSDWSSRDQVQTPDDDQLDEEEDVDDEDEEQESRGGVQPNLRDRRPPVNRDLRIGFGNRSTPDANGRGGPGQQKKSRGVASFVLGVPLADRVKGQPNPGKTKVTQQRIEPEPETAEPAEAAPGLPRAGATDPVFHPVMSPWLRELVRSYFLEQRRTASPGTAPPGTGSSSAPSDPSPSPSPSPTPDPEGDA